MLYITKRDGRKEPFNKRKIERAMEKAYLQVDGEIDEYAEEKIHNIANFIEHKVEGGEDLGVEEIQDLVENGLMNTRDKDVARAYIIYRNDRNRARGNFIDNTIEEIAESKSEYWNTENSNKNSVIVTTQRDYFAGAISTDYTMRKLLPKDVAEAHAEGIIHFHDADYFAQKTLNNCCLINLEDMLQNGTVINDVLIEKPHKFLTAATIATQIILGVSSSQYGGCTVSLTHLAPFVRDSFYSHFKDALIYVADYTEEDAKAVVDKMKKENISILLNDYYKSEYPESVQKYAMDKTKKEVNAGVQTFNYQVNSMSNTNGQTPFLSVNMYLGETEDYKDELAMIIEEFLNQRILGFKNAQGVYITPAFPKLLYVLEEDNIHEDSKYWYLTELAAKCTAKRMVPDYISEKIMLRDKVDSEGNGHCYPPMGCRSFLTPYIDKDGKPKYYGRCNAGVVTINLPDVALSSGGDFEKFWKIFDERAELCHRALRLRYDRLADATSDVAPLLWQNGAFSRLKPGDKLGDLIKDGYATVSLGYAGLYECVKYMTGESHSNGKGLEFGLKVMQFMNDKFKQWRDSEGIAYSLYGTPIESTTYKFAKALRKRFGVIEGITDHDYITNSYHINVREKISAFDKLQVESQYQKLSPGGAISYVEVPNMQNNIPAVLELMKFMYDNIMYAEINSKSDYCSNCGYDGEIIIKGEPGHLYWECPKCHCNNQKMLYIARRTCGYIGTQKWNQGRTEEIRDRELHIGGNDACMEIPMRPNECSYAS